MLPSLKYRSNTPEAMDDPSSDIGKLENTLRRFAVINVALTRFRFLLKKFIISKMEEEPSRSYRAVDLGAGACETDVWLLQRARQRGLKLDIVAYDHDPRVVAYARRCYGHISGLSIVQRDICQIDREPAPDFVYANHVLHHLDDAKCCELIGVLSLLKDVGVLISDIERSRLAYLSYALLAAPFSGNSFALADGLISIRKGFRREELEKMVQYGAGDRSGWSVERLFPSRLVVYKGV